MIEVIFTLDYEIYGNGTGSLRELVYEPADRLREIFKTHKTRFVLFPEVLELEAIEREKANPNIELVKKQIKELYEEGFEIGLHIHPQWYNAQREGGRWVLDYREYNLCKLERERIAQIIDRSTDYLRAILGEADFTPMSFRAGNWLLQPTREVGSVLAERGVKVDSSVFKGGLQRQQGLDYRRALRNGYYWKFSDDANVEDTRGTLLELPIYTHMVPFWRMATGKRICLQQKGSGGGRSRNGRLSRLLDFLRFRYPLKLDFCRMTVEELTRMLDTVIKKDREDPTSFKPLVAIGHTKDLVDVKGVESFLAYLKQSAIPVVTFEQAYPRLIQA
jgi:hypothetical protein